ncbi:MAG: hypothetical protein JXA16_14555 [Bacteroidales bacterium]|nr:hypothetical protein [Bacteroidales bacterium]
MTILVIAYILGHLISTTSYYLIEKLFIVGIKNLKDKFTNNKSPIPDLKKMLDSNKTPNLYKIIEKKFLELSNGKYSKSNMRLLICEVEENKPSIYSTALVFLTFYGMARSIALVFLIAFIYEMIMIIKTQTFPFYSFIYLAIGIISLLHFIRFKRYFLSQIINGFIIK